MKDYLVSAAVGVMVLASGAVAGAADVMWPSTTREAKSFVQTMPQDAWSRMILASLDLRFFGDKPIVAVINPSDEEIENVICDDKWFLVGADAYNKAKGAPSSLGPRTVTFIPTDSFDGYCKESITALTESGEHLTGELSIPGDFTHSTAIKFKVSK